MEHEKKSTTRRDFMKKSLIGATVLTTTSVVEISAGQAKATRLRLGGPVFEKYTDPDGWVKAVKKLGYRAAYCPVRAEAKDDVVKAYARAAQKADIVIAEVGAWSNPISPVDKTRREALEK